MGSRFTELIVDAANPDQLAQCWMAVLGWQPTGRYPSPAVEIADPGRGEGRVGPTITFVPVPDEKCGKNRLHIDINPVGCDQDAEVARLINLGARQTCCYPDVFQPIIGDYRFDHTVDHIFAKPKVKELDSFVTGDDPSVTIGPDKLVSSDHGGVVSKLKLKSKKKK